MLCLMIAAACSQRVELKRSIPTPETEELVTVSFATTIGELPTYLRATTPQELDMKKTIAVKDLRIVLYANDDTGQPKSVAYTFDRQINILKGKAAGKDLLNFDFETGRLEVKQTEKIEVGNYSVLFFLSPTAALKEATAVGKSYDELSKPIRLDFSERADQSIIYSIYSNIESPLVIQEKQLKSALSAQLFRIESPTLKALTAMVYMKVDEDLKDPKFYIPEGSMCIVYADAQRNSVVPNPQYSEITLDDQTKVKIPQSLPYSGLGEEKTVLSQNFVYYNLLNGWDNRHRFGMGDKDKDNWIMPIPENTLAGSDVNTYTATRLIIQVPVVPKEIQSDFDQDLQYAQAQNDLNYGWMKVGKSYYTNRTFRTAYANAIAERTPSATEKLIIQAGKELTATATKARPEDINKSASLKFPMHNYRSEVIEYYQRGLSYKVLPIRHFSDQQLAKRNADGRFSVVRNTLYMYHLKITSIGQCDMEEYDRFIKYDSQLFPGNVGLGISKPTIIFAEHSL